MTPEEILNALTVQEGLPREAMIAAGERRDQMIPLFLERIERLTEASINTLDEPDLSAFLIVYFLLGEWRDARAYRPLTALLRKDPDLLDRLLGDAVTEGTARVIAGVCDGDLQPINAVIEDAAADEFVRCQMVDALVVIASESPEARPEVVALLERFPDIEVDKPQPLWGAWAFAIADLGLVHLEPQVREAFKREWISPAEADFALFQKQMHEAIEAGEPRWYHDSRNSRPIESAVDELSRWHCFSKDYLKDRARERPRGKALPQLFGNTFKRDAPKVGRNDPCPCGSGKKYKKCCLQ